MEFKDHLMKSREIASRLLCFQYECQINTQYA
jgi:hypothetical protein